jgi:regulator of protease activity HflC (stomatin/prohibitin superfamily)
MTAATLWFVLGLVLLVAELATGTFYLLMLAVAFAAGGLVALLGGAAALQLVVAAAIESPGGAEAVNFKVAERYIEAFAGLAKTNNTLIVPANLGDVSSLIATAMTVVKHQAGKGN